MPQLSLSWLGLGLEAASPWLLLLLVGASWLLARVLTQIYACCENSRRLQCFPQPPKRNWFLGHLDMIPPTEQGMKKVTQLVTTYPKCFMIWMGPIIPVITLCHPDTIRPILSASALLHISCCGTQGHDVLQLLETLAGKPSEYIATILDLSALVTRRGHNLLMYMDFLYHLTPDGQHFRKACRLVHDFTGAVIQERRQTLPDQDVDDFLLAKAKSKTLDFIDVLLLTKDEDGKMLSDEDIRAEADTFMFEGHDTTASGLSWVLYNLAKHPEYQERCRQEVRELLRDRDPKDIEWDDLAQLPFLTMCIKESLRLHPPVVFITRRCTQDVMLPDGAVIPKGVTCAISIFGTHHNPAVWPDPEVYDPFRFDPENIKDRSPLAFIPFSAGPRNCIGQTFAMSEMKVALALTLLRFRVLPDHAEPRRKPELILRAEGGLWLRVEPLRAGAR
ncbi:cytochrome P450 4F2-like isoform X2 [Castor canadensis]|uniref:Cytochrome P450 4F2-like isoform X2 n=1 Tax=Castor canadensis TaxID=51338 RepID=A0AC58KYI3_CASCN